jgi:hypothetical protein
MKGTPNARDIEELRQALTAQHGELRQLREMVARLTGQAPPAVLAPRSRRELLKLAGAGVVGAAGAAALIPKHAAAASTSGGVEGGDLVIGAYKSGSTTANTSDTTTQLELTINATTATDVPSAPYDLPWVFLADAVPNSGFASTYVVGVGAFGANGGSGAIAGSDTGYDLVAGGTGRLAQYAGNASSAAPGFAGYAYDPADDFWVYEIDRGQDGEIWAALYDAAQASSGAAQAGYFWKRVNSARFDLPDGSGNAFVPQRALDTRSNGGPLSAGATRNVPIAQSWNGSALVTPVHGVPSTAVGIAGNLTAVDPSFSGFLTVYPTGTTKPATSTVNFVANGAPTPNGFIVGLGSGGSVTVAAGPSVSGQHVEFILDVTAYFQ